MLKPKILQLEVTNDCNLNCSICMRTKSNRKVGYLSLEDFSKIPIEEFKEISFHGWGEPLLHPNLFEFVKMAHERGAETSLITNATLLDLRLNDVLKSDLNSIAFGIFTTKGKEKVFQNIREFCMRNDGIKAFIDITILPWNLEDIEKIVRFAGELGIDVVLHRLFYIHLDIKLSKKDVKTACKVAKEVGKEFGIKVYCPPRSSRPCVVAISCIFLGWDLTASPCCFLHELGYNYRSLSFEEHKRFLKEMRKNEVCKRCPW
ncbi:radical SAM protein [Archaeoglobus sp.]